MQNIDVKSFETAVKERLMESISICKDTRLLERLADAMELQLLLSNAEKRSA